jgi:PAS domain S-box-containing protein
MAGESELERLRRENAELSARLERSATPKHVDAEAFLDAILSALPAFVIRFDSELRIRYINRLQPGLTMESVVGESLFRYMDPEYHELARVTIERVLETGEPARYDTVARGPHGKPAFYESYVAPICNDAHRGGCLIAVEVTEHRARQLALEESERRLQLALDAGGVGLWTWDPLSGEVFWDDRLKAIVGRDTPTDLYDYTANVVHPEDRARVEANGRKIFETGAWSTETHRIVKPDGSVRWVMSSGDVIREGDKVVRLLGCNIDITEHHALEEQMRRAQKLEATGRLTAGIAHNFNNLLAAILPTLELLAPVAPSTHQDILLEASHAARRAAELVTGLMTFAGQRRTSSRQPESVTLLVEQALGICRSAIDRRIQLQAKLPDTPLWVECDGGAIEQVLLNLLLNARDALHDATERSDLCIEVEVSLASAASDGQGKDRRFARIRVSDNGVGMSEAVKARVFEPFFTTKAVGHGTGLGLSTSYAIVHEHRGTIELESAPGHGTSFTVLLPLLEDVTREGSTRPLTRGSTLLTHVLLIEDEASVSRVTSRLLEAAGHRVTVTGGTREALTKISQETPLGAQVVLLDRSMPDGPGESIIPKLRQFLPDVRILLFTGQDVEPEVAALADGVLSKPTRGNELLAAIDAALRARP